MKVVNNLIDLKNYEKHEFLGKGNFGKVYKVIEKNTGEIYAGKISKEEIQESDIKDEKILLLFREVNIMSAIYHPSILQYIGYSRINFKGDPKPVIITELAPKGSLANIIHDESIMVAPYDWDDTKKLINIFGIASGMKYLHSHEIIHRDLKTDNILMDENLFPKIADFGLAKISNSVFKSLNINSRAGLKGTPIYIAPESLISEQYRKAGDVYSFAFIISSIMDPDMQIDINGNFYNLIHRVTADCYRPKFTKTLLRGDRSKEANTNNQNRFYNKFN